jgi:hypothetical protein
MSLKSKTACVVDNGLFVELAVTLAPYFKDVFYTCPWESAFPKSNSVLIGKGLPGVTRIDSIWPYLDEIDLFVYPDVYKGPEQIHLESLGKRVWGSRMGEDLELDRVWAKGHMESVGIDVGGYKIVKGLDNLREYLKDHKNVYVKVSKTRGDMETFCSKNYKLTEPQLDEMEYKLGAKKNVLEFIVEDAIDDAVEVSYDGYSIDGKFMQNAMAGIEVKDRCLIMTTKPYEELPDQIRETNAKISSTLRAFRYRNFFANELRITKDGIAYSIDPCCRMGSPPGELFQTMITNLADVIWHGAAGELVEPEFAAPWGAELLLHSQWADSNWQAVEFPKSLANSVKLRNRTMLNGRNYVVPQAVGLPEIGAAVALGDTMEEAIANVKKVADQVEGYCIHSMQDSLDEAVGEIKKLADFGIDLFSDATPDEAEEAKEDTNSLASLLSGRKKSLSDDLSEALGRR